MVLAERKRQISSSPITARIRRFENLVLSGYEPLKVFSHLYLDASDEQTVIFIQNVFGKYNENGVEEYGILTLMDIETVKLSIIGAFARSTVGGLQLTPLDVPQELRELLRQTGTQIGTVFRFLFNLRYFVDGAYNQNLHTKYVLDLQTTYRQEVEVVSKPSAVYSARHYRMNVRAGDMSPDIGWEITFHEQSSSSPLMRRRTVGGVVLRRGSSSSPIGKHEPSMKGKKKAGVSKWDLLEEFSRQLADMPRDVALKLQGLQNMGERRQILADRGLDIVYEIDGKFFNQEVEKFLKKFAVKQGNILVKNKLRYGGHGRFLKAYLGDGFDYIIKTYYDPSKRKYVQAEWIDNGYWLARERLGGLAVPTLVIDAIKDKSKEFTYILENEGHRTADIAIIQQKITPLLEYLKVLKRSGREEEARRYIDIYKEIVLSMFRRGVYDMDFGGTLANYGVNELDGRLYIFDFGDLTGGIVNTYDFVENIDIVGKYVEDGIRVEVDEGLADYFAAHPFVESDFYEKRKGKQVYLFGDSITRGIPAEFGMTAFPLDETQVRELFAHNNVNHVDGSSSSPARAEVAAKTTPGIAGTMPLLDMEAIKEFYKGMAGKEQGVFRPAEPRSERYHGLQSAGIHGQMLSREKVKQGGIRGPDQAARRGIGRRMLTVLIATSFLTSIPRNIDSSSFFISRDIIYGLPQKTLAQLALYRPLRPRLTVAGLGGSDILRHPAAAEIFETVERTAPAVAVTLDQPFWAARSSSPLSLDEEEQLIEELFRRLEQQHYEPEDILAVRDAVALSRALYEGKTFASGEGFLRHALKVALTLVDWKTEISAVLAGLFHKLPVGELEEILGPEALRPFAHLMDRDLSGVRGLIRRLYNITTYWPYVGGYIHSVEGQKTLQNYMNGIIQLTEGDPSTLLLVFADKIQAVPVAATKAERTYCYQELDHIYTRLASRLNIYLNGHNLFEELRNKGFQLHDPEGYQRTSEAQEETWGLSDSEMNQELERIKQEIIPMFEQNGINAKVEGRRKTIFSRYEKVHSRRRPEIRAFEEIDDVIGVCVIAEDVEGA
ncbi:MAG TPA: hypothetical protein DD648_07570, partial [Candidatus Omnitrophica bacterium]|nr:hypothetical protein [Candidatus Omnitrophota bacterium]